MRFSFLVLLAVTAALTTPVPAGAEMRTLTLRDWAVSARATSTDADYQRAAFTPAPAHGSRRPAPGGDRISARIGSSYAEEIAEAAARYAVPERLIWAVIRAESGFDPRAVSHKGAQGLMQLMPATAAILGVRNSFNPRENIDAGVRHLRDLMDQFGNNVQLAVGAYNAGAKAVHTYRGIPPYPETQEYVRRVLSFYGGPVESRRMTASGIYQIIEPDGTVLYTNIPPDLRPARASR